MPEALADLSGPLRQTFGRELPNSDLVRRIWSSIRDLCNTHGVSEEALANVVPESFRTRPYRANETGESRESDVEVLPAQDAETGSPHKAQHTVGQQVNRARYQRHVASLHQLPKTADPSGSNDVFGGTKPEILPRLSNGPYRDQALSPD